LWRDVYWIVKHSPSSAPLVPPEPAPTSCPKCQSTKIVTSAKKHNAESYWRCTACGEIWNVKRSHQPNQFGGNRWR
jgi:hypothetical protein